MNLAFADFLYCALYLTTHFISWNSTIGIIFASIRLGNVYSEWISVGVVAAVRSFTVTNPGKITIFSSRRNRIIIFVLIRIYGFAYLIPSKGHFEVSNVPSV